MNPALAAAVAASQPSPPPAKPLPVRDATETDEQIVAKGTALQLQETWRGHFVGDKLSKAGAHPAACCCCDRPLPLDKLKPQADRGLVPRLCMLEHRYAAVEQGSTDASCTSCAAVSWSARMWSCGHLPLHAASNVWAWTWTAVPAGADAFQQQ